MNYEIREDRDGNVYVKDLALISVSSYDEVIAVINQGLKLRATHETKMNAVSSRSHTVFTITVVQRDRATGEAVSGKLNLGEDSQGGFGGVVLTKAESSPAAVQTKKWANVDGKWVQVTLGQ